MRWSAWREHEAVRSGKAVAVPEHYARPRRKWVFSFSWPLVQVEGIFPKHSFTWRIPDLVLMFRTRIVLLVFEIDHLRMFVFSSCCTTCRKFSGAPSRYNTRLRKKANGTTHRSIKFLELRSHWVRLALLVFAFFRAYCFVGWVGNCVRGQISRKTETRRKRDIAEACLSGFR